MVLEDIPHDERWLGLRFCVSIDVSVADLNVVVLYTLLTTYDISFLHQQNGITLTVYPLCLLLPRPTFQSLSLIVAYLFSSSQPITL